MSAPFPHGISVVVERGDRDRYGDTAWVDHHTVSGCAVAPRGTPVEDTDRREAATFSLTLYTPPASGILHTDRVRLPDGTRYLVDGPPADWAQYGHPITGWKPGVEIVLKRVEG